MAIFISRLNNWGACQAKLKYSWCCYVDDVIQIATSKNQTFLHEVPWVAHCTPPVTTWIVISVSSFERFCIRWVEPVLLVTPLSLFYRLTNHYFGFKLLTQPKMSLIHNDDNSQVDRNESPRTKRFCIRWVEPVVLVTPLSLSYHLTNHYFSFKFFTHPKMWLIHNIVA